MIVKKPGDEADEHGADAGPDGISCADLHGPEGQGQRIEGRSVSENNDQRGSEAREAFGGFQRRGGNDFREDGDGEVEPVHGLVVAEGELRRAFFVPWR